MPRNQMIALFIFFIALMDSFLGLVVVRPRVKEEKAKAILTYAFIASGLILSGIAYAIWSGQLPIKS